MDRARLSSITNKLTHWRNEQILDCVERVEDRQYSREEIAQFGRVMLYKDGSGMFYWKGKKMIYFHPPKVDSLSMLDVVAEHLYEDRKESYVNHNKD